MSDSIDTFLGLDVSKFHVDVCALDPRGRLLLREKLPRTSAAFAALAQRLSPRTLAVLEATGGLERLPAKTLEAAGLHVVVENPKKMRHYALSHGREEKSDALDARLLARYALERRPAPRNPPDPIVEQLQQLTARRRQLVRLRTAERARLRDEVCAAVQLSLCASVDFLTAQIEQIEAAIRALIASSDRLRLRFDLLTSAPGVGFATAAELLATMPELGELSRGQAAKLSGLAPLVQQSGIWRGETHISGGRKTVRAALHMAILSTVRHDPYFRSAYQALLARGKPKKLALTAIARRLLNVLNQMLKTNSPFNPALLPASTP